MYCPAEDVHSLLRRLDEGPPTPGTTLFVAVTDPLRERLPYLVEALRERALPFFGGLFPGLVHGGEVVHRGALLVTLPLARPVHLVRDIDRTAFELNGVAGLGQHDGAALVLVDALSSGTGRFLNRLYHHLGAAVPCFGAAAGSLTAGPAPCLFTPDGLFRHAALVAPLPWQGEMRASHGWHRLSGPLVATRTDGNVIHDLNWDVASEVYRSAVRAAAGVDPGGHLAEAHAYPLGLRRDADEDVVRDVVGVTPEGGLVCTGSVPEHTVLHILTCAAAPEAPAGASPGEGVLAGARWGLVAASSTRLRCGDGGATRSFADLGTRFAAAGLGAPDGVLTLGEICSHGGRIELHNKTIASGLFYDRAGGPPAPLPGPSSPTAA